MLPLIGITCGYDYGSNKYLMHRDYTASVEAAGGIPVLLPYVEGKEKLKKLAASIHGLLISGGPDLDPAFFGEEPLPEMGRICPERDVFEISIAREAFLLGVPILGICRGIQVLNVAAGGDLYQDLRSQYGSPLIKHYQDAPPWLATHHITIAEGTRLANILGSGDVRVNSFHHQAVRRVAPGYAVSAWSSDNVIEGIEKEGGVFALGVQCHPEGMWERNPLFLKLFKKLVQEARVLSG